jgi:hypothetical protein
MANATVAQTRPTIETSQTTGGALTRTAAAAGSDIIRTPEDYGAHVQRWQSERMHILSPVANFSGMPAHFGLIATRVQINPDPNAGEVYADRLFCKDDEVAIAKPGLARIAQAGGMTIKTERTDPRDMPNYWEVRATLRFIGLDGTPQEIDNTAEYDLRDGSPRVLKMLEAAKRNNRDATPQIIGARQYGLRGAEARAINAAIRQFGIRQKYHKSELLKPFLMVRVVFLPDMTDPTTRAQVNERALAGSTALYPGIGSQRAMVPAPEVIDVIGATGQDGPGAPGTKAPAPLDPGRLVLNVSHDMEAGTYDVTLEGGEVLTAQSDDIAKLGIVAKKSGQRVRPTLDQSGLLTGLVTVAGEDKY